MKCIKFMWDYTLKFGLAMIFLCGALKDLRRCFTKYFSVDYTLTKHSVTDVERFQIHGLPHAAFVGVLTFTLTGAFNDGTLNLWHILIGDVITDIHLNTKHTPLFWSFPFICALLWLWWLWLLLSSCLFSSCFFCGKIIPLNDKNEFFICTPPEKELDKGGWVRKKAKNNPCPSFHSIDPLKWNNMRDTWDVMIPLPGCQSLTGWHDMTSNEVGDHIYVYGTNNCIVEKHQNPDILYIRYADTWYM